MTSGGDHAEGSQRFADLAGGPATIQGVRYQIKLSTMQVLHLLVDAARDPTDPLVISPEKRLTAPDGQYGYDLGWTGGRGRSTDEMWEAKLAPSRADVVEFVTTLRHRVKSSNGNTVVPATLVAGQETAPYRGFQRLVRLAHEATDAAVFAELVAKADEDYLSQLATDLGDELWSTLRRASSPLFWSMNSIEITVDALCAVLARPRKRDELESAIENRLAECATARRSMGAAAFAAELQDRRLLMPPSVVDYASAQDHELDAFALLQLCPVPLADGALAAALGSSASELENLLSDLRTTGAVTKVDGAWFALADSMAQVVVPSLSGLVARALSALIGIADQRRPAAAAQTPNALALSRVALTERPDLVANVFAAFDKPSKVWGDLSTVQSLADLSAEGARTVAEGDATIETAKRMAAIRARTYICGSGWVLQRVDELDEAAALMDAAAELSADGDVPKNQAFTAKCRGRLSRMRAEDLDVTSIERAALLDESVELLNIAYPLFEQLVTSGDTECLEDLGECRSLLARTYAAAMDWDTATNLAAEAHSILDPLPTTKAYADLVVLDAELTLREQFQHPNADQGRRLRDHLDALTALMERHRFLTSAGGDDRAASEIVARISVASGRLHAALGDTEAAMEQFTEAASVYQHLLYPLAQCRVLWERALVLPESLPSELMRALDGASADPITRALAVEAYEAWREGSASANIDDHSVAEVFWQGLVNNAELRARASRPRWGEGKRSA